MPARATAETHVIAALLIDIASPPTAVLAGSRRMPAYPASQLCLSTNVDELALCPGT